MMAESLYEALGGEAPVTAISHAFYDEMEQQEPALARLHPPFDGTISAKARADFADFLIFWTGGPKQYLERRGHPRLVMRHAHLPIDAAMRDAWLRCMTIAVAQSVPAGPGPEALIARMAEVAAFLQNVGPSDG